MVLPLLVAMRLRVVILNRVILSMVIPLHLLNRAVMPRDTDLIPAALMTAKEPILPQPIPLNKVDTLSRAATVPLMVLMLPRQAMLKEATLLNKAAIPLNRVVILLNKAVIPLNKAVIPLNKVVIPLHLL